MDYSGFQITRLKNLELKGGISEALNKCIEQDIPVFIRCPQSVSIWAIPNNFDQTITGYLNHEENGGLAEWVDRDTFSKASFFKFKDLVTESIPVSPAKVEEELLIIQLKKSDIVQLLSFKKSEVEKITSLYKLDEEQKLKSISSFSCTLFSHQMFSSSEELSTARQLQFKLPISCKYRDVRLVVCHAYKENIQNFNDPLKHLTVINYADEDCFVLSTQTNALTDFLIKDIPEDSPYYIPENCRQSSKLNQLAVIGHRLYIDKSIEPPRNLMAFIKERFSLTKREHQAGAFFINPTPQGDMGEEFRGKTQFRHLIDVYFTYFINGKLNKEESISTTRQRIRNTFQTDYGYHTDICSGAAKLIMPESQ